MPFQFTCPNGHLLQGEPHQAGQQCQCPHCGLVFVIPAPPTQALPMAMPTGPAPAPMAVPPHQAAAPPAPAPEWTAPAVGPMGPTFPPAEETAEEAPLPQVGPRKRSGPSFPDVKNPSAAGRVAFDPTGAVAGPKMLHIPCPNGHVLETPPEMVGEEVICPHCSRQFTLREKDSQEYKRKRREDQEKRDIRAGKNWFTWAVLIAAVVVIGLIIMIAVGDW